MIERVVILGAGESGTGAALLAKQKGFEVFVSDQGPIKDKYKEEINNAAIPFEENKHTAEKILNASLIIKSPGIPLKADIIKKVSAAGISIIDELEFASMYTDAKIIAITGTNGKTTTTLLTYHILKECGFNVGLAGNVGFSMARQVATEQYSWYVLEMSSFQLDGIKTFKPEISILLNITPDHLDRYEYSLENYINSKFQLIQNMGPNQHFIYYVNDPIIEREVNRRTLIPKQVPVSLAPSSKAPVHFDGEKMNFNLAEGFRIRQSDTTLKGPHNLINTMSAVTAASLAGASTHGIKDALKTFKNAPHRLESVATINGVEFVNDSKATNVDSVVYALGSYSQQLIWIAGGIDKGNDYNIIMDEVKKKVRVLICLGKDNSKLRKAFGDVVEQLYETQSVPDLIRQAMKVARAGEVVLLSPACASFDLFKNYEDRGDQFRKAVLDLKKEVEGQRV